MPVWASLKVRSKFNSTPATPGCAAERNLPLTESAWLRTGASSRLEIELDEGSAWRLGPDSQIEISDYARLSTGQHFTVLSLDHGVAYFTGEPGGARYADAGDPGRAGDPAARGARAPTGGRGGPAGFP